MTDTPMNTHPIPPASGDLEAMRAVIDTATHAALPLANGMAGIKKRAGIQVDIADRILAALYATPASQDALIARVRTVLEPFANYPLSVKMDGSVAADEYQLTGRHQDGEYRTLTNGHLQAARALLADLNAGAGT